jgi:hypothetical protein
MMKKKLVPTMATFAVGAAFGVGFVLSCSDNSPRRTDAATCDCPASEPPLAGRFVTVSGGITIPPNVVDGGGVVCPAGSQLITGSCTTTILNDPGVANLVLLESGSFDPPAIPTSWHCEFKNNGATPVDVKATVICLKPGP